MKKKETDLEKTVAKLTEQNNQLQENLKILEQELKNGGGGARLAGMLGDMNNDEDFIGKLVAEAGDAIPREPEKSKLMGHRARVTKLAFHPIYT